MKNSLPPVQKAEARVWNDLFIKVAQQQQHQLGETFAKVRPLLSAVGLL